MRSLRSSSVAGDEARSRREILEAEGCTECHAPPHCTNNKLMLVPGFDPKWLRGDDVPTGWKGPGVKTRAVPGHKFDHDLSADIDRVLENALTHGDFARLS